MSRCNYPGGNKIVLSERCPEDLSVGQLSLVGTVRGAIALGSNCLGANCPGGSCPGVIVRGATVQGGISIDGRQKTSNERLMDRRRKNGSI